MHGLLTFPERTGLRAEEQWVLKPRWGRLNRCGHAAVPSRESGMLGTRSPAGKWFRHGPAGSADRAARWCRAAGDGGTGQTPLLLRPMAQ